MSFGDSGVRRRPRRSVPSLALHSMRRFTSKGIWIGLAAAFCLASALLVSVSKSQRLKITPHLTAADVRAVRNVVRQENSLRRHSPLLRWAPSTIHEWFANLSHPIKSIEDTTNNLHELNRQMLSSLAAEATTNPAVEARLHDIEKQIRTQPTAGINPAVEVWYADRTARWGEAGYVLEKGSNGWKATIELFR